MFRAKKPDHYEMRKSSKTYFYFCSNALTQSMEVEGVADKSARTGDETQKKLRRFGACKIAVRGKQLPLLFGSYGPARLMPEFEAWCPTSATLKLSFDGEIIRFGQFIGNLRQYYVFNDRDDRKSP